MSVTQSTRSLHSSTQVGHFPSTEKQISRPKYADVGENRMFLRNCRSGAEFFCETDKDFQRQTLRPRARIDLQSGKYFFGSRARPVGLKQLKHHLATLAECPFHDPIEKWDLLGREKSFTPQHQLHAGGIHIRWWKKCPCRDFEKLFRLITKLQKQRKLSVILVPCSRHDPFNHLALQRRHD